MHAEYNIVVEREVLRIVTKMGIGPAAGCVIGEGVKRGRLRLRVHLQYTNMKGR